MFLRQDRPARLGAATELLFGAAAPENSLEESARSMIRVHRDMSSKIAEQLVLKSFLQRVSKSGVLHVKLLSAFIRSHAFIRFQKYSRSINRILRAVSSPVER